MILGYGLGALGQGAAYYFMSSYFVVFLTNCVGLGAAAAGTISSIALLVEVIAGMTVGNLSDKCTSKMGRRRPFMLTSSIVMLPILVIMLHSVDGSLHLKPHIICSLQFCSGYSSPLMRYLTMLWERK